MGLQAARFVVPRMLLTFRWFSLDSGFVLANVLSGSSVPGSGVTRGDQPRRSRG